MSEREYLDKSFLLDNRLSTMDDREPGRWYPMERTDHLLPSRTTRDKKMSSESKIYSMSFEKMVWRVLWCLSFLVFFLAAMYQCGGLLDIYFKYPYTVSVSVDSSPLITLPGITFCSSLGVRKTSLEAMPGFNDSVAALADRVNKDLNESVTDVMRQEIYDTYYSKYMDETTVQSIITNGINFTEFILVDKVLCALDQVLMTDDVTNHTKTDVNTPDRQNREIGCKTEITKGFIETLQGTSMCWTLFHESQKSNLTRIKVPSGFTQSAVLINKEAERRMHERKRGRRGEEDDTIQPLEIVRFLVNFTVHESVKLDSPTSGTVSVHDPDQIRLGRLQSFDIHPGKYYEVFLEEQQSKLLKYPYDTDCYPYLEENWDAHLKVKWGEKAPHPIFGKPISMADCKFGCLGITTVKRCNCWPPEIPYVNTEHYQRFLKERNLKLCDWERVGLRMKERDETPWSGDTNSSRSVSMKAFSKCFSHKKLVSTCNRRCRRECVRSRIKTTVQEREWPSEERIRYAPEEDKILLKNYQTCCAVLSIRKVSSEITTYTYAAKYEPVEFVSYIGGIVSLYLGFTFVGIIDYFEAVVKFAVKHFGKYSPSKDDSKSCIQGQTQKRETPLPSLSPPPYFSNGQEDIPWYMDFRNNNNRKTLIRSFADPIPIERLACRCGTKRGHHRPE